MYKLHRPLLYHTLYVPVVKDDRTSAIPVLCLLQYSNEINDGGTVRRNGLLQPLSVLVVLQHTTLVDLGNGREGEGKR